MDIKCVASIVPEIKKVLASNHNDCQYACLVWIVKHLPIIVLIEIIIDPKRLAYNPTVKEKEYENDVEAREILKSLGEDTTHDVKIEKG
ncbi:hypothetical protein ABE354_04890 [Brevibacillus laterosporus]|uniref:hypothetical protein n=1 Tax=Brevibacillus laterosporus TaxID=1465 RepID=UPI003D210F7D